MISDCYCAYLVKEGETLTATITTSGVTATNSAIYNNLADLFNQLKSGALKFENGWNTNYWKVENNALYFGNTRIDII